METGPMAPTIELIPQVVAESELEAVAPSKAILIDILRHRAYPTTTDIAQEELSALPEREGGIDFDSLVSTGDRKLTSEGRDVAKAFFQAVNYDSPRSVRQKIEEIRELQHDALLRDEYDGKDSEILFYQRLASSIEMQLRNNEVVAAQAELQADIGPDSWTDVMDISRDLRREKLSPGALDEALELLTTALSTSHEHLLEDGKLTDEGKALAKAIFEKSGCYSLEEARRGVLGRLKIEHDGVKQEIETAQEGTSNLDDKVRLLKDKSTLLQRMRASVEMQARAREAQDVAPAVEQITIIRNQILDTLRQDITSTPDHPLTQTDDDGLLLAIRVAEKRAIAKYREELRDVKDIKLSSADCVRFIYSDIGFQEGQGVGLATFFQDVLETPGGSDQNADVAPTPNDDMDPDTHRDALATQILEIMSAVEDAPLPDLDAIDKMLCPPKKDSQCTKANDRVKRLAATITSFATAAASILGLFGGLDMARVDAVQAIVPYAQYATHEGLDTSLVRGQLETIRWTERVSGVVTQARTIDNMVDISDQAMTDCLTTTTLADGTQMLIYNSEGADSRLCREMFPGIKFVDDQRFFNVLPDYVDVPTGYENDVIVKDFLMNREQGATCSLTAITSIINHFRIRDSLPPIHSWVASDLMQSKVIDKGSIISKGDVRTRQNIPEDDDSLIGVNQRLNAGQPSAKGEQTVVPSHEVTSIDDFNAFYFDTAGLREMADISFTQEDLEGVWGIDLDREQRELYAMEHPDIVGAKLATHYRELLEKGDIPTLAAVVREGGGHAVVVVGVGEDAGGQPYLMVAEPNGGYTGWDYTKRPDGWQKIGNYGLVKIPLNGWNLRNMVPYTRHTSFHDFDSDDLQQERFAMPFTESIILTQQNITPPDQVPVDISSTQTISVTTTSLSNLNISDDPNLGNP